MQRDAAVAEIKLLLGFRTDLDASAVLGLQNAQEHFEQNWPDPSNLPWFLISDRETLYTVASDERIALPSDWLGDVENDALWITNSDGDEKLLRKYDLDDLRRRYINSDAAFPVSYAFDGLYYRLFPLPDDIYTVKLQYYKKDALLSTGATENQWLKYAADVLIGRAGAMLSGGSKNSNMQIFLARQNDGIAAVNSRSIWTLMQNRQMAMGETL